MKTSMYKIVFFAAASLLVACGSVNNVADSGKELGSQGNTSSLKDTQALYASYDSDSAILIERPSGGTYEEPNAMKCYAFARIKGSLNNESGGEAYECEDGNCRSTYFKSYADAVAWCGR